MQMQKQIQIQIHTHLFGLFWKCFLYGDSIYVKLVRRFGIKSVTFLSQPSIKFEFPYFAPYPLSPSSKDKATNRPALYKAEGVAISLVMHLIGCQQLSTCQLIIITLYLQHLNFSSSKHAHRCISFLLTGAKFWEGVNVVAAVLIDKRVNLGEGGKENWQFLILQIPPWGKS